MNVFLVVDGMNLIHRGFYASYGFGPGKKDPSELTAEEFASIACRGFINIIVADIKRVKATHVAVVFDRPGENFRHRLYTGYKANRNKLDSMDMRVIVAPARKLLIAMGIKVYGKKGVEGDDLIGSIAVRMSKYGRVYIDSNDKDFASLVNKRIHLLKPKGVMLDAAGVETEYGVPPSQMVDYLMLLGDKVDNVPGVYNVGAKTAVKLLSEYKSVENIVKKAKLTPAMKKNFDAAESNFKVTRKLITIDTSYFSALSADSIKLNGVERNLKAVCDSLGFKSTYTMITNALG